MKKKTGLIGLYSGRKIKEMAAKGERLTRKQTAKQALKAIEDKYGKVVDSAKYYHAGAGKWVRRSKDADAGRTGNVTTSVEKWRRQPHKYDLRGVDTKGSGGAEPKKKVKLSPSMLKAPAPKGRGKRVPPKPKTVLKDIHGKTIKSLQKLPLSYKKKTQIPKSLAGLKHPIIIRRGKQYYIRKPWGEYTYSDLKAEKTRFNDLHFKDRYYMAGMGGIGSFGILKLVERGKPPRIEYSESSLAGMNRINIDLSKPKNPVVYRWEEAKGVDLKSKTVDEIIKEAREKKQASQSALYVPKIPDDVIVLLGRGKIEEAKNLFVSAYTKANRAVPYDDKRIIAAFEKFKTKAIEDFLKFSKESFKMKRDLDSRLTFRSAWYAQGKARDDKKINDAYKFFISATPTKKREVKKTTKTTKRTKATVIKNAHEDWDEQAKALMLYKIPFKDKTLKACVNRHLKDAGY